jgi:SAM-dependent methyltransferase
MDLKETDILGPAVGKHWYYRAKAQALARMLAGLTPSRILDVGAGSGFFSRYLLEHGTAHEAWCVDISYQADTDDSVAGKPVYRRRNVGALPCDLVLLMDVLEHVDDDLALLREQVEKVPSGAVVLISVPAFRWLWSSHDDFLGHKRRYTLDQVESLVARAGLECERAAYFFGLVLPLAALTRLPERARKIWGNAGPPASHLRVHAPLVNTALLLASQGELPWMRWNRVAGLTVFCLARKP